MEEGSVIYGDDSLLIDSGTLDKSNETLLEFSDFGRQMSFQRQWRVRSKYGDHILIDDITGKKVEDLIDECNIYEFAARIRGKRKMRVDFRDQIVRT